MLQQSECLTRVGSIYMTFAMNRQRVPFRRSTTRSAASPLTKRPALTICALLSLLIHLCAATDFHYDAEDCVRNCPFQNGTEMANDLWCDAACRTQNCATGCSRWREALHSGCYAICNSANGQVRGQPLYCLLGCQEAVSSVTKDLQDRIGRMRAPSLVAGSVTNTSLSLQWNTTSAAIGWPESLKFSLQWLYTATTTPTSPSPSFSEPQNGGHQGGGTWQDVPMDKMNRTDQSGSTLVGLRPYTKYRFRLVTVLGAKTEPFVSEESAHIRTLPYGSPSDAPRNLNVIVVDSTRISVSWDPPQSTNGALVAYVLQAREKGSEQPGLVKDLIVERDNSRSYVFTHLKPNTTYTVSVAARNSVDIGPVVVKDITTTPVEKSLRPDPEAFLFVANYSSITRHPANLTRFDDPEFVYQSPHPITGLAVHYRQSTLFVADDQGNITELSISTLPAHIQHQWKIPDSINWQIKDLSVDWLYNRLYMILENNGTKRSDHTKWQIARCGFDGRQHSVVITEMNHKPLHIEVDPFNGFLVWTIQHATVGGLYRVDLADLKQDHPLTFNWSANGGSPIQRIIKHHHLGAFTVDHINSRILAIDPSNNKVLSIQLGRVDEWEVIRSNVSHVENVTYMSHLDEIFYWVNNADTVFEEKADQQNTYLPGETHALVLFCAKNQPIPVPVAPVKNLQALFGSNVVHISWETPPGIASGRGAWQNWSYDVEIHNVDTESYSFNRTNQTDLYVQNLQPNATYRINVTPSSAGGTGRRCNEPFVGRTLPNTEPPPVVYWASNHAIYESNALSSNVRTFVDMTQFQVSPSEPVHIVSMAWMHDSMYVVTNASRMYKVDSASHQVSPIAQSNELQPISVAADWLGQKIYWSSRRSGIARSSPNGSHTDIVVPGAVSKHIAIHSIKGRLFWITDHSVDGSLLNGEEHCIYWGSPFFSVRQAVGLTIDYDSDRLYWIVWEKNGVSLYRTDIDGPCSKSSPVHTLETSTAIGPLQFLSGRLLWLQEETQVVVSDLNGQNISLLQSPAHRRTSFFTVVDERHRHLPASISGPVNVVPDAVQASSISIRRPSTAVDSAEVTWRPVTNVNYNNTRVRYTIEILADSYNFKGQTVATNKLIIPSNPDIPPCSNLTVSIRAFTVWSLSETVVKLPSPPSRPSAPQNPRAFVSFLRHSSNRNSTIVFRWSPPAVGRCNVGSYRINCWQEKNGVKTSICNGVEVPGHVLEYKRTGLSEKQMYYFTVSAISSVGSGPTTAIVNVSTTKEMPVPLLLIFTNDTFWLADVDTQTLGSQQSGKSGSEVSSPPLAVSFISREEQVFWIDDKNIYSHKLDSNQLPPIKIRQLDGSGSGLAIDWVSRHVYWSEKDSARNRSFIYRLDLESEGRQAELVLSNNHAIRIVQIDPFAGRLIWMSVSDDGIAKLMATNIHRNVTEPFFQSRQPGSNCPSNPELLTVTAVDWSRADYPRLLWIRLETSDVWSSDWNGSQCRMELDVSDIKRTGWPPSSMALDQYYFYWSNATEGRVYKMKRSQSSNAVMEQLRLPSDRTGNTSTAFQARESFTAQEVRGVRAITTLGTNQQPLPDPECLVPLYPPAVPYVVKVLNTSATNSTVEMPLPRRLDRCSTITTASPRYHLYYGPDSNETDSCRFRSARCRSKTTTDSVVVLTDLMPYTRYVVRVRVTNCYTDFEDAVQENNIGHATTFTTKPGAPSGPRDVRVVVLTPKSVRLQWKEPQFQNGPNISYSVLWIGPGDDRDERRCSGSSVDLIGLFKPNQPYTFLVRAFSSDQTMHSDSLPVRSTTYNNPPPLTALIRKPNGLTLQWKSPKEVIKRHTLEMEIIRGGSKEWKVVSRPESTEANKFYNFSISDLSVKTMYLFRLRLEYADSVEPYIWGSADAIYSPHGSLFLFETLGDVPDRPERPNVSKEPAVTKIWWAPAKANGYTIKYYIIQVKRSDEVDTSPMHNNSNEPLKMQRSSSSDSASMWMILSNTTDTYYVIPNLTSGYEYQFRVQAVNELGASSFSPESLPLFQEPTELALSNQNMKIVLGVSLTALLAFFFIMFAFAYYICRRPESKKSCTSTSRQVPGVEMSSLPCPDLATLRELPQREGFIHQNNAIYGVGDVDLYEELALLPHIRKEDLTLTTFLGSGAFGEVFEGFATNLPGANQVVRVAVKTLRKGATDQEKSEFLKEALLMSHFKHDHILRLLGLCLDTNPNFILLELMEGGDLLSFLRNNRPSQSNHCRLSLLDLVSMCVDVAKGCCYLEELHFVHRDLAARNCLVSSADPTLRVVKIGDFGLARDIYRNDYYRKEGEGLLPVRWMAPESLVDGVFTSQTDVWSFGVLLWEILTLGQQPYPARTNLQVLHFVRNGGRLDRPPDCPDSLFQLMMSCWSYEPSDRPSFSQCLDDLLKLHDRLQHAPFTVHNGHYVGTPAYRGCDNIAYFQDENHNARTKVPLPGRRHSTSSASYLEDGCIHMPAEYPDVQYANQLVIALNEMANRNSEKVTRGRNGHRIVSLERCSSERSPAGLQGHRDDRRPRDSGTVTRSNSTIGSCPSNSHGRYLELLGDHSSVVNDGYEVPRSGRHIQRMFPKTNGLLQQQQQFHSSTSNSQIDGNDDCLSDVTDESCVAHSPTPLCANQVFRISSASDMTATPSDTDC